MDGGQWAAMLWLHYQLYMSDCGWRFVYVALQSTGNCSPPFDSWKMFLYWKLMDELTLESKLSTVVPVMNEICHRFRCIYTPKPQYKRSQTLLRLKPQMSPDVKWSLLSAPYLRFSNDARRNFETMAPKGSIMETGVGNRRTTSLQVWSLMSPCERLGLC